MRRTSLVLSFPRAAARSRVVVGPGSLADAGRLVASTLAARRIALIGDAFVLRRHGAPLVRALEGGGLRVSVVPLPRGEAAKRPEVLARTWRALASAGFTRSNAVVGFGGGAALDVAGLVAATWLRGLPWAAVPTTLLAQVDASVGGKTAVDLPEGKNLAGAFHQPALVIADPRVLETLPARHVRSGLAEVVKMGFAVDAPLFRWVESNVDALRARNPEALAEAVRRSVRVKGRIVTADEFERAGGVRTALNFGHTAGHAIEAALGFTRVHHGEAVAIGMRIAASLSESVVGLSREHRVRLEAVLDALELPQAMPRVPLARLLAAMQRDKKRASRAVRWVLTTQIGDASVPRAVELPLVRAALIAHGAHASR